MARISAVDPQSGFAGPGDCTQRFAGLRIMTDLHEPERRPVILKRLLPA
jgi:hypothetical protein